MTDGDYIFGPDPPRHPRGRWGWIETCLLGDVRTALDGVAYCYHNPVVRQQLEERDRIERGGGNLALPVVVWMAVDLVSDLYSGEADESMRARHFIHDFFPGESRAVGWLLWDGMRNAMTHTYLPRSYDLGGGEYLRFVFTSEPCAAGASAIVVDPSSNDIIVHANLFGLYDALRHAVAQYGMQLEACSALQARFRSRWEGIEQTVGLRGPQNKPREAASGLSDMRGELSRLRSVLQTGGSLPLF